MTFQKTTKFKSIKKKITDILNTILPPISTVTSGIYIGLQFTNNDYCDAYVSEITSGLYNSTSIAQYGNTTETPDEVLFYGFVMENLCKNFSISDVKLAIGILSLLLNAMSWVCNILVEKKNNKIEKAYASLSAQVSQQESRAISLQGFANNEPYYTENMPLTVRSLDSNLTNITIASSTSTAFPDPVVYR